MLSYNYKCKRLDIGLHPSSHGFLFSGITKLSSNISLVTLPPSENPTSFATISALSWICLASWGSIHSLLTSCSFRCFPSSGTSHLMYKSCLSSAVNREFILLARNSLSCLNARILHRHGYRNQLHCKICKWAEFECTSNGKWYIFWQKMWLFSSSVHLGGTVIEIH